MQYKEHLNKGSSSLQKADLDSAEQQFAAALKLVHVRDPTAQQYQREVEPLCKLGDVYSKRGQQTGDGGDFVKAAALYNAAIARSSDYGLNDGIDKAITCTEGLFVKHVLDLDHNVQTAGKDKHKKNLKEMRDQIKLEMETIEQQLDPYVHDENDPCVKEIEAKRAQAVRRLFERIASERKQFVSQLVEECVLLMGPPPCKYSLIGLGSQATELVTPYSDLEFAILVEDESEECLMYFRNLTHYLHLKVVNLGETILPALGIRSLNEFFSQDPLDDWYYDSVTPRGFAFDGSMPRASKTPLGRQATTNKPPSELIRSPNNMVNILETDATVYIKEGYHLASILRNLSLLVGDQDLVNEYLAIVRDVLTNDEGKMALLEAQDTLRENMGKYDKQELTAKLIDVKKEIYRLPSLAVDCCALCSHVIPTSVWNTIDEMESTLVISTDNAHHLRVLVSISAELRLRTYIANSGQNENLSALASLETPQETEDTLSRLQTVFYVSKSAQLFRYYYTAMRRAIYGKSTAHPNIATSLNNLGGAWSHLGHSKKAISYYEQALQIIRMIYGHRKDHPLIASALNNLGTAWQHLGDYRKAISYKEQVLQMRKVIYGSVWCNLKDYKKAISYHDEALQMCRHIHGQSTAHVDIATSLKLLGSAWHNHDHKKAISCLDEALQMYRSIYGPNTEHSDIADSLQRLGLAWEGQGHHQECISYHEEALQMYRNIHHSTS
ncbi:KLC1 [Branchiostoma lanceolatum]|uniref:KLC1 protein n=1 Tax=Branchiostoma lanceolatum TaxID=7740 RepID=A0A8J9ZA81_BRALA|nr:KLC1 [Branchiostoma lanceolatum]